MVGKAVDCAVMSVATVLPECVWTWGTTVVSSKAERARLARVDVICGWQRLTVGDCREREGREWGGGGGYETGGEREEEENGQGKPIVREA